MVDRCYRFVVDRDYRFVVDRDGVGSCHKDKGHAGPCEYPKPERHVQQVIERQHASDRDQKLKIERIINEWMCRDMGPNPLDGWQNAANRDRLIDCLVAGLAESSTQQAPVLPWCAHYENGARCTNEVENGDKFCRQHVPVTQRAPEPRMACPACGTMGEHKCKIDKIRHPNPVAQQAEARAICAREITNRIKASIEEEMPLEPPYSEYDIIERHISAYLAEQGKSK